MDLGRQGFVHGAAFGDLQQPRSLLVSESPAQLDLPLDAINLLLRGGGSPLVARRARMPVRAEDFRLSTGRPGLAFGEPTIRRIVES